MVGTESVREASLMEGGPIQSLLCSVFVQSLSITVMYSKSDVLYHLSSFFLCSKSNVLYHLSCFFCGVRI